MLHFFGKPITQASYHTSEKKRLPSESAVFGRRFLTGLILFLIPVIYLLSISAPQNTSKEIEQNQKKDLIVLEESEWSIQAIDDQLKLVSGIIAYTPRLKGHIELYSYQHSIQTQPNQVDMPALERFAIALPVGMLKGPESLRMSLFLQLRLARLVLTREVLRYMSENRMRLETQILSDSLVISIALPAGGESYASLTNMLEKLLPVLAKDIQKEVPVLDPTTMGQIQVGFTKQEKAMYVLADQLYKQFESQIAAQPIPSLDCQSVGMAWVGPQALSRAQLKVIEAVCLALGVVTTQKAKQVLVEPYTLMAQGNQGPSFWLQQIKLTNKIEDYWLNRWVASAMNKRIQKQADQSQQMSFWWLPQGDTTLWSLMGQQKLSPKGIELAALTQVLNQVTSAPFIQSEILEVSAQLLQTYQQLHQDFMRFSGFLSTTSLYQRPLWSKEQVAKFFQELKLNKLNEWFEQGKIGHLASPKEHPDP